MRYYAHKDMDMLERTFLDNGLDGYVDLCKDLCHKFMEACDTFEQFNNFLDYWNHVKWLDTIVTINTTNVVKGTFEVLYLKKGDEEYDESKKQFLAKLHKIQVAWRRYFGNKTKMMPWQVQALKGAMEAHMDGGVVWLPPYTKVMEILGDRMEGGYAKARQVRILKMENIPSDIDFAGKLPKATNDFAQRDERSLEALACLVLHAGVIKYWVLHPNTIEAYMLWWNGSSLTIIGQNIIPKCPRQQVTKTIIS